MFKESNYEYTVKVAETDAEATKLIAIGYEYVSTMGDQQNYREKK